MSPLVPVALILAGSLTCAGGYMLALRALDIDMSPRPVRQFLSAVGVFFMLCVVVALLPLSRFLFGFLFGGAR